jgi:RNA polymerase sigma-70 factor (ECF subfamily)
LTSLLSEPDFASLVDPYRRELLAHCYRMLGSYHDAEDALQDTLLRAWRGFGQFEGRSSVRTWLYRIATRVCLTAADSRERRVLPSGIGDPVEDGTAPLASRRPEVPWLEPIPDHAFAPDPADVVTSRETTRLAFVAALQNLPARQRAALLLRDVVGLSAAEVAELLDLSTVAVNSALLRARARIELRPRSEEAVVNNVDESLLEQYITAYENGDLPALAALLRHDVELEMPPIPTWFAGRDAVVEFYAYRPLRSPRPRLLATRANGCPAVASYHLEPGGTYAAHSIQVLETAGGKVTHIYSFLDTSLFPVFGLPLSLVALSAKRQRKTLPQAAGGERSPARILVMAPSKTSCWLLGPSEAGPSASAAAR